MPGSEPRAAARRVLIVDDEPTAVDPLEFALGRAGFEVEVVGSRAEAEAAIARRSPDLAVLDIGLPDGSGLDLLRSLRARTRLPVLMLTCHADELDRVVGLELGADDYVTKPFSPREVVARVKGILRRVLEPQEGPAVLRLGRSEVRPGEHRVLLGPDEIPLTRTELALLSTLLSAPTKVFDRDRLMDVAYRGEVVVSGRTIDSHIKGIRRKFTDVDPAADPIETVRGVGYRARCVR